MNYLKAFVVGGLLCVIGQILLDKTKLTSGRILVIFVSTGCILSGVGLYEHLVDFAGAGATVPLTGFGHLLSQGVIEEVDKVGFLGIFTGSLKSSAGGIGIAIIFSYIAALVFNPKPK